jgi:hypothetical protein
MRRIAAANRIAKRAMKNSSAYRLNIQYRMIAARIIETV